MSDLDVAIATLAARQGGAFSLRQARSLGTHPSLIQRRRAAGRWIPAACGVLVVAGSVPDERQRLWVAWLSLGERMVFSHETAGRLEDLPAIPGDVLAVTLPHFDHRRRPGWVVHQQHLDPRDVTTVDGFPVTTVPRTVCDLAMVVSRARLAKIVDAVQFDRRIPLTQLGETLLRVGTVGRPGSSRLTEELDRRGPGSNLSQSHLERLLGDVLALTDLPTGIEQHPLPGVGRRNGMVDRAFPEAKLILEADGRRWHARHEAMASDGQRVLEGSRVGWMTLRLMHAHLTSDPDDVARAIAETYRSRLFSAA
jgi:hypothetical protein